MTDASIILITVYLCLIILGGESSSNSNQGKTISLAIKIKLN